MIPQHATLRRLAERDPSQRLVFTTAELAELLDRVARDAAFEAENKLLPAPYREHIPRQIEDELDRVFGAPQGEVNVDVHVDVRVDKKVNAGAAEAGHSKDDMPRLPPPRKLLSWRR